MTEIAEVLGKVEAEVSSWHPWLEAFLGLSVFERGRAVQGILLVVFVTAGVWKLGCYAVTEGLPGYPGHPEYKSRRKRRRR